MSDRMQMDLTKLPQSPEGLGVLAPWRVQASFLAFQWHCLDIADGTHEGNRVIGTEIFPAGGRRADPDYENGKTSWCGMFVEACFRPLGFRGSLASVGRCLGYGYYNAQYQMRNYRGWQVLRTEQGVFAVSAYDHHDINDLRRGVWAWDDDERPMPLPGDIVLHQEKPGSWHGHVMMCAGVDLVSRTITVVEGNHSKTIGPAGKRRDGVGLRRLPMKSDYFHWLVRPSPLDFHGEKMYLTEADAEAVAKTS